MNKLVVVFACCIVYAMAASKPRIPLNYTCFFHAYAVTDKASEYDYYGMLHGSQIIATKKVYHTQSPYVTLTRYDVLDSSGKALSITTDANGCNEQFVYAGGENTYFEYDRGPENCLCPDQNSICKKYCSNTICVVVDNYGRKVQDITMGLSIAYSWLEDEPSVDVFTAKRCSGSTERIVNYCSLSSLTLNYSCAFHAKFTDSSTGYLYDLYGMMNGNDFLYIREDVHIDTHCYYGIYRFDLRGTDGPLVETNVTGTCSIYYVEPQDLITTFQFNQAPENALCPDKNSICKKYCLEDYCIIVDKYGRLVEQGEGDRFLTYTWMDDVPTTDIFDVHCSGNRPYKAMNICSLSTLAINYSCAFHGKLSYEGGYNDWYGMMDGKEFVYSRMYYHNSIGDYYHVIHFDKRNSQGFLISGNQSGVCKTDYAFVEGYIVEWQYDHDPVDVLCPDKSNNCKKYCYIDDYVTVDGDGRMVELSLYDGEEKVTITWMDDVPDPSMFDADLCNNTIVKGLNYCRPKLPIHYDCAFHAILTNDDGYTEMYGMMDGTNFAYVRQEIHPDAGDHYYAIIRFDLKNAEGKYLVVSNDSGICQDDYLFVDGFITEWPYGTDPENVLCPDKNSICKKYCYHDSCLTVDGDGRMVEMDQAHSGKTVVTWLDDVPSTDMFDAKLCNGETVSAIDYCSHTASSSVKSSSVKSSSVKSSSVKQPSQLSVDSAPMSMTSSAIMIAVLLVILF